MGDTGDVPGLRRTVLANDIALENVFSTRAGLGADAVYITNDGPKLVIKEVADASDAGRLHERAWNLGLAPLLWIVTPTEVRVFDAFRGIGRSEQSGELKAFKVGLATELQELDDLCGRFSLDTGAFWSSTLAAGMGRSGKVDRVLLEEVRSLEDELVKATGPFESQEAVAQARAQSQELIMCTLFASFLLERGTAQPMLPHHIPTDLAMVFSSRDTTHELFAWLHEKFNGDVFPEGIGREFNDHHLSLLEDFVRGTSLTPRAQGQMRLFRFRFDTIPIELISSVYEAFARRAAGNMAKALGLHYTSVELVHMALDPIFDGLQPGARILDPTCGSGIFLVQSFRRMVWQSCGEGARPRSVVRKILYEQVHGIDLEQAALRIAAFSLYVAAMELETKALSGEPTQFKRLIGLTLHRADFLSPRGRAIANGVSPTAIVGNPPWTHGALKRARQTDEEHETPSALALGQTNQDTGARRAPDHRFLAQAMEIVGKDGRLAMYLKATPFLSRSREATLFRKHVVDSLSRLALLNLSPLRHEALFSEAKSPGLLLCANCGNLPDETAILVGTFPWTPDFAHSGALALSSADIQVVTKKQVLATPSALKATMLGTRRDVQVMQRIEQDFGSLSVLLKSANVTYGQGFQVKGLARNKPKPIPKEIASLPSIFPEHYQPISTDNLNLLNLADRGVDKLLFPRIRDLYTAPLLLFPKSAHAKALQLGRTSAAISNRDVAFSHGFYGFSFAKADPRLAVVLCALLNSAVSGYQFLFGAGALGIERPSILLQDLLAIRVPDLNLSDEMALEASAALTAARKDGCKGLDNFAARLYGLGSEERELIRGAVRRGRSLFLDRKYDRADDAAPPLLAHLTEYAMGACKTVNAVLRIAGEERRLVAGVAVPRATGSNLLDRFGVVRFTIKPGRPPASNWVRESDDESIEEEVRERLVRSPTPYLRERRSVRIYGDEGVIVIKPAQRRYWTGASGMEDGDAILADHRMQVAQ